MIVTVYLSAAMICFAGQCSNALVGVKTPQGNFPLVQVKTDQPGYGGDVLAFAQDRSGLYAIHRVWLLSPAQRRAQRLQSSRASDRVGITGGCINVAPEVYERLSGATKLEVKP